MGRGVAAGAWVLAALITLGAGRPDGLGDRPGQRRAARVFAALLRSDPAHALIARVWVGEAPVGLALVDHGGRIVVADSNRFLAPGATSSLAVVNVGAALAGKPALAGLLPAGQFPREMAPEPGGRTLLVTNFNSGQVELVNVAGLP